MSQDNPRIDPRHVAAHNPTAEEASARVTRRLRQLRTPNTAAFRAELAAELTEQDGPFHAAVQRIVDGLAKRFRDEPEAS